MDLVDLVASKATVGHAWWKEKSCDHRLCLGAPAITLWRKYLNHPGNFGNFSSGCRAFHSL